MALTITITDPKIIKLIEQKAAEAGISASEAVEHALGQENTKTVDQADQDHPRLSDEYKEARRERVLKTLAEIHELVTDEDRAFDYDAWLYDENGLPH
ncbi:MAG TPA: type II toxin-antitoxin system VapB family antitoxin [Thermomicrobiales bacterium]|nr:type II toxin-antitoxin system VapB family antitoxin [Thermomicrobiales bacterium]